MKYSSFVREALLPGWTTGQDGDVPLFHHFASEVSSSVSSRNCSHCNSQTGHDLTAQALLHLCHPQAAESSLLWRHSLSQVGKRAFTKDCSTAQVRIFLLCTSMQPHDTGASNCISLDCSVQWCVPFFPKDFQRQRWFSCLTHGIQLTRLLANSFTEQYACLHNTIINNTK